MADGHIDSVGSFADVIGQLTDEAQQSIELTSPWAQGRAIYGGVVGGLLAGIMRRQADADRPMRSFMLSFVGPAQVGQADLSANVLRSGRSVTQLESRLVQGEQTQAMAMASFGAPRDSDIVVAPEPRPDAKAPDGLPEFPFVEGLTPAFTRQLDFRWASGGWPYSGQKNPDFTGWIRFREPGKATPEWLLGLIDAWPPGLLSMCKPPAANSSMTWSVETVTPCDDAPVDDWWFYDVHHHGAADGFGQASARIFTPDGRLAAVSRQSVAIFDKR